MFKSRLFLAGLIAGVALATAGQASARDTKQIAAPSSQQATQAPWYERFTFGSEVRDGANSWVPRGDVRAAIKVDSRSRWGVTFGVQQEPRAALAPQAGLSTRKTSAGVTYSISPSFQVGGAVVLPEERLGISQKRDETKRREPGVKVESAFKF